MNQPPLRCVVDTNVMTTANNANEGAPPGCVLASTKALAAIMASGHVFIDASGLIVREYRKNLNARGQPNPGDAFLKWLLTHEWSGNRVTRVPITPHGDEEFVELATPPSGVVYDRSDRKFLAVAAAHEEHPVILQSFDSKWWGWTAALATIGVHIHFLCEHEIAKKYEQKMGS
jgi:hypothetical protein